MSFSQFIKINQIIENYRNKDITNEESSFQNNHETIKSSSSRPKATKNKKLGTNINLIKKEKFKIVNKESFNEKLNNISNFKDYNEIYDNIILLLNNLINDNKNHENKLCKMLNSIYNYIYNINTRNKIKSENQSSLIVYKNSNKIKRCKTSNESKKFEIRQREKDFKKNEYNYLVYINELHKKITKFEHELNIKSAKKRTLKDNIKLLFNMDTTKYYSKEQLKIRKTSFTINAKKFHFRINKLLEKGKKKNNLKISLKDIYNDYERKDNEEVKFYNNKKYLLSHPRLNFNGYIHNNKGQLSSVVNEKINRIPKEAFGVKLHTKLQNNFKSYLQLTFNPIKFRVEKLRTNKTLKTLKI